MLLKELLEVCEQGEHGTLDGSISIYAPHEGEIGIFSYKDKEELASSPEFPKLETQKVRSYKLLEGKRGHGLKVYLEIPQSWYRGGKLQSPLAFRITRAIESSGLSYEALSKKTGIPEAVLRKYTRQRTEGIALSRLKAISEATGVSARYLAGFGGFKTIEEEEKKTDIFSIAKHGILLRRLKEGVEKGWISFGPEFYTKSKEDVPPERKAKIQEMILTELEQIMELVEKY